MVACGNRAQRPSCAAFEIAMSGLEIAPVSDVAAKAGVTLDDASQQANTQESNLQHIADSRELALEYLTTVELNGARDFQSDVFGSTVASNESASELSGKPMGAQELTPDQQRAADMMIDLYIAGAKFGAAWKVVNGVGKDVKSMLQTS